MADGGSKPTNEALSWHEYDKKAIEKYNENLKEKLTREKILIRQYFWRGNRVAPFSIEPMPYERQRLAEPMSAADRALRKQWVLDQRLSPNEPVHVAELNPRNPIRRALATPWNMLFKSLKPFLGDKWATKLRGAVPKITVGWIIACAMYYNVAYNPNQWSNIDGWHVYGNKPTRIYGEDNFLGGPEKTDKDFHDCGFQKRKAFLGDYETSSKAF